MFALSGKSAEIVMRFAQLFMRFAQLLTGPKRPRPVLL
jgi:hypothetical protein